MKKSLYKALEAMPGETCGKTRVVHPISSAIESESVLKGSSAQYILTCSKKWGHDDPSRSLREQYHYDDDRQQGWHPPVERILK